GIVDKDHTKEILEKYELSWMSRGIVTSVIEIINYDELQGAYSDEFLSMNMKEMTSMMNKMIKHDVLCEIVHLDYKRYVIVNEKSSVAVLKSVLTSLLSNIGESLDFNVVVVIGSEGELLDLNRIYKSILIILDNKFMFNRKNLVLLNEL